MTTTAHKDQFTPEPDLESECRQALAKALDVCVWAKLGVISYRVSCINFKPIAGDRLCFYKFCPFCGKRIKVKK